jgi:hypothetical protein
MQCILQSDAVPGIYDCLLFLNFNLPLRHFTRLFMIRTRLATSSRVILSIRTLLPKRTKPSQKTLTYPASLDMSLTTLWSQRTKSSLIPRTHTSPCLRINMSIQTLLHILTIPMFIVEPACYQPCHTENGENGGERAGVGTFRHLADVVFVEEFTDIAFFAET